MGTDGIAATLFIAAASGGVGAYLQSLIRGSRPQQIGALSASERSPGQFLAPARSADFDIPSTPSPLRRDVQASLERALTAADLELLGRYLVDIRDLTGGTEAVFWRWSESRDALVPWAWSTDAAPRPAHFRMAEWGPRVRSVAEDRRGFFLGGRRPFFAAIPVVGASRLHGVLTVSASCGLAVEGEAAEQWLWRHATHLAMLLDLFEMRREYGRSMRQGHALLAAVERIHSHRSAAALGEAICAVALEVTSARASALVRWDAALIAGVVQHATEGLGVSAGFGVSSDSLVASAARAEAPVLVDQGGRVERGRLFGPGERQRGGGPVAVVPIMRDSGPIGCVVITGDSEGSITDQESRNVGLLCALAANALEIVWEIEEVSRRADTDALTGLANRRRFDESLQRELSHSDRFGQPVSLVLVDLDHFKRVNDCYGHEAGDAVLRCVAQTLADGVRAVDVCARFGGEELAILLPQTTAAGAFELADRLRRRIAGRPVRVAEAEIPVTASFGVASYPDLVRTRDALFQAADAALYGAKRDGRNCVRVAEVSGLSVLT